MGFQLLSGMSMFLLLITFTVKPMLKKDESASRLNAKRWIPWWSFSHFYIGGVVRAFVTALSDLKHRETKVISLDFLFIHNAMLLTSSVNPVPWLCRQDQWFLKADSHFICFFFQRFLSLDSN